MRSFGTYLFFAVYFLIDFASLAQEICDDRIDNDNNGFVDCYDSSCFGDQDCEGFFFGNDVFCENPATQNPSLELKLKWASDNETASSTTAIAVGDVDGDYTPEIIVTNRINQTIHIINGRTGKEEYSREVGFEIANSIAVAKLPNNNLAAIFVRSQGPQGYLAAYNYTLNKIWIKNNAGLDGFTGILSVADFDQDGKPELLNGNEIRDAATGDLLLDATGDFQTEVPFGTLAYDVLNDQYCNNCSGLELIAGGEVYAINTSTIPWKKEKVEAVNDILPTDQPYQIKGKNQNFNTSALADYNTDGHVDIILSGGQNIDGEVKTTVFFWDLFNNNIITYHPPNNHGNGTGNISVADFDGDGSLNSGFLSGNKFYVLDSDFSLLWSKDIGKTSGYLGHTIFDFNDDKSYEIIYRSQEGLFILDGNTSEILSQTTCKSTTGYEYPILADIDKDGSTEICIACNIQGEADLANENLGQIRAYAAQEGESWLPSRSVWNQFSYFNVNVNDDLSIPNVPQDLSKTFSSNICSTGPNRSLNHFMAQFTQLNTMGCPSYVSHDLEFISMELGENYVCTESSLNVFITIKNIGDLTLLGQLPVTFYKENPALTTSVKLNTDYSYFLKLDLNQSVTIPFKVNSTEEVFDLYAVINDDGTSTLPRSQFNTKFRECDQTNNQGTLDVAVGSFNISAEIINKDIDCATKTGHNGEVRAFYPGDSNPELTYYWRKANNLEDTIFEGETLKNVIADTYYIVSASKDETCYSKPLTVVIKSLEEGSNLIYSKHSNANAMSKCLNSSLDLSVTGTYNSYKWYTKVEGNNNFTLAGTDPTISIENEAEVKVQLETNNGCSLTTNSVNITNRDPTDVQISVSELNMIETNDHLIKTIKPNSGQETIELSINNKTIFREWKPENALLNTSISSDRIVDILVSDEDQQIVVEWKTLIGCTEKDSVIIKPFSEVLFTSDPIPESNAIFPNPIIDGKIHIRSQISEIHKVEIYSIAGDLLLSNQGTHFAETIDVSTFQNGLYLVKISLVDQNSMIKRILIRN